MTQNGESKMCDEQMNWRPDNGEPTTPYVNLSLNKASQESIYSLGHSSQEDIFVHDGLSSAESSEQVIQVICERLQYRNIGCKFYNNSKSVRRNPGDNYMKSNTALRLLPELLADIRETENVQSMINDRYLRIVDLVVGESSPPCEKNKGQRKTTKFKAYWNQDLSAKWKYMHKCDRIYRKCLKSGHSAWTHRQEKQNFLLAREQFDKLLKHHKRDYSKGLLIQIEQANFNNPTAFWDHIKHLGPRKESGISWEFWENEQLYTDKPTVLQKWKESFEELYNSSSNDFDNDFKAKLCTEHELLLAKSDSVNQELNKPITYLEIKTVVDKAKNKKSAGIDGIPYELLKQKDVIELMYEFFNACLRTQLIPDTWRTTIIKPIPKEDPLSIDPQKYRGLALQCCIYKIFSGVLNNRITVHMDENKLLADEQNGFRKDRSCLHHIFTLTNTLKMKCHDRKEPVYAAFVDFAKAFDLTDRPLLYYSLHKNGVDGACLELIKQMYTNTVNMLRINGHLTDPFYNKIGLKQGDNLSPMCFSQLINGLIEKLKELNCGAKLKDLDISCLAYADDIVLLSDTEDGLQRLLNELDDWCRKWRVKINSNKTKVIHFRPRGHQLSDKNFKVGDSTLEIVSKYKYLGVVINEFVESNCIVDHLSLSASCALGGVINKTRSNYDLGYTSFSKLFNACVVPILDYGSGAWCTGYQTNCKALDKIQYRAARFFMGVPRTTALTGEIGWTPGVVRRDLNVLRLYNQLTRMPSDRLTRKVFNVDCDLGVKGWAMNVKSLCVSIGAVEEWNNRVPVNIKHAQNTLLAVYKEAWLNQLQQKPKLYLYRQLKESMEPPPYVREFIPKSKRSLLAQLYCGSLPLEVESQWQFGTARESRICKLCNVEVETELHFLFRCMRNIDVRIKNYHKFPEILNLASDVEKLKFLNEHPYKLTNFMSELWEGRTIHQAAD